MSVCDTFIDLGSGVAGDMLIGALVGLGLPVSELTATLQRAVAERNWKLTVRGVERQGWPAYAVTVEGDRPFGGYRKMHQRVSRASLPEAVKKRALQILATLEKAERQAHGSDASHWDPAGIGRLDTLVDILGSSWGFWKLGIEKVKTTPLNPGRFAPATAVMIQQFAIPVHDSQSVYELATPTGVAILSQLSTEYRSLSFERLERTGYGAGNRDIPGRPNVLAIHQAAAQKVWPQDEVVLLETVIDDMDPRLYPHVTDLLIKEGAIDVWWSAIGMKKGRPGISFSVLSPPNRERQILSVLFRETTTLGIRRAPLQRWVLPRMSKDLYKIAILPHGETKKQVEYEKARQKAEHFSIPLRKLLK